MAERSYIEDDRDLTWVGAKIEREDAEALARLARDNDRPRSSELRQAIREYLDRQVVKPNG